MSWKFEYDKVAVMSNVRRGNKTSPTKLATDPLSLDAMQLIAVGFSIKSTPGSLTNFQTHTPFART